MTGPLAGIRVVDVTSTILGPYATQMLGDLGAEVIKVEPPEMGDIARGMGVAKTPGMGATFLNINRNKRSLAIDLKQPAGRDALWRLVGTADVFFHNMRTQAMDRLGFGYAAVSARNPSIIYAVANGFGQDGPYRDKPAFDDIIQASSGLAGMFERRDGTAAYAPMALADKVSGLFAAQAVLAALYHRARTGQGQQVEVPMFESLIAFNLLEHLGGATFVPPVEGIGYQRVLEPARRPFPTKDGSVSILPYTDRQWRVFFGLAGRPELMDDPRFSAYAVRGRNLGILYTLVAALTPQRTTAEWIERCDALEIPCMPVIRLEQLPDDPHVKAVNLLEPHEHPSEGPVRMVRSPMRFSATPAGIRSHAPRHGEHSRHILAELGFSDPDIDAMAAAGAAFCAGTPPTP